MHLPRQTNMDITLPLSRSCGLEANEGGKILVLLLSEKIVSFFHHCWRIIICWQFVGIWEECCCWSSIVPPNSSVWGPTLIFTFNPLTLPSPLKCHEKESADFWRYISQKKAEPWGFFLPCSERIDQISNALFKFDNISRFESHSQLLCWEWSQKFFSSWIGNAICAICAICANRATVLTFKQEELEKWDPLLNIKGLSWNIGFR